MIFFSVAQHGDRQTHHEQSSLPHCYRQRIATTTVIPSMYSSCLFTRLTQQQQKKELPSKEDRETTCITNCI